MRDSLRRLDFRLFVALGAHGELPVVLEGSCMPLAGCRSLFVAPLRPSVSGNHAHNVCTSIVVLCNYDVTLVSLR